ncbi:MAG: sigma-70 family RNA polymerase sigma factor, partial [Muribaculaceae bacterium]|nr:sigma-70 family RNA polymerase sigma factor [Muribaculaceae bacterium]
LETLAAFDGFDEAIDEAEHQEWLTKMVMRQMNELPDRCREIFEMCKLQGLRYAEVAEQLGISVNTVECQMGIALKKLRTALQPIRPS